MKHKKIFIIITALSMSYLENMHAVKRKELASTIEMPLSKRAKTEKQEFLESLTSLDQKLKEAALASNIPLMIYLINQGADPNTVTIANTLTMDNDSLLQWLFNKKTEFNSFNKDHYTLAQLLIKKSDQSIKNNFIEKNRHIYALLLAAPNFYENQLILDLLTLEPDQTKAIDTIRLLHHFIDAENIPMIEKILKLRPSLVLLNEENFTPLEEAINTKNLKTIELLIDNGALLNEPSSLGFLPLYAAVRSPNLSIFKLLINKGADPYKIEPHTNTSIFNFAVQELEESKTQEILYFLLKNNIYDISTLNLEDLQDALDDIFNYSSFFTKVMSFLLRLPEAEFITQLPLYTNPTNDSQFYELVELLQTKDKTGMNLLMWAAALGKSEVVKKLLSYESTTLDNLPSGEPFVDLMQKTNEGETALDLAKKNNHPEIYKIIYDRLKGTQEAITQALETGPNPESALPEFKDLPTEKLPREVSEYITEFIVGERPPASK